MPENAPVNVDGLEWAAARGMGALAEKMGLAEAGLTERFARLLQRIGLPTDCVGLDAGAIRQAMSADKKKAGGKLKFALPKCIGEVVWGIEVEEALLLATLRILTEA